MCSRRLSKFLSLLRHPPSYSYRRVVHHYTQTKTKVAFRRITSIFLSFSLRMQNYILQYYNCRANCNLGKNMLLLFMYELADKCVYTTHL